MDFNEQGKIYISEERSDEKSVNYFVEPEDINKKENNRKGSHKFNHKIRDSM